MYAWFKWLATTVVLYLLGTIVILNSIENYFSDNLEDLKKQFSQLAYSQMVKEVIFRNHFIKENFEISGHSNRLKISRINDRNSLPSSIKIFPLYYWNDLLVKEILDREFSNLINKKQQTDTSNIQYMAIISNIKLSDENVKAIKASENFAYLVCESEEDVYKSIEVFLFKVCGDNYKVNFRNAL